MIEQIFINMGVATFGVCAFILILTVKVKKTIPQWLFLASVLFSSLTMMISPHLYERGFATFSAVMAAGAVYWTIRAIQKGRLL